MSRFDAMVARWAGFGVYDTPAPAPAPVAPVEDPVASVVDTVYADTAEEVAAAELDVIGQLSALMESRLSPLEACRALFNPIVEEGP